VVSCACPYRRPSCPPAASVPRLALGHLQRVGLGVNVTKVEERDRLEPALPILSGECPVRVLPGLVNAARQEIDCAELRDIEGLILQRLIWRLSLSASSRSAPPRQGGLRVYTQRVNTPGTARCQEALASLACDEPGDAPEIFRRVSWKITFSLPASKSAAVRARLNHPVIDSDGHTVEFLPAVLDYLEQTGGWHGEDVHRCKAA
jgi:hypothetical protein